MFRLSYFGGLHGDPIFILLFLNGQMYIFDLGKLEKDWNCRSIMARLPLSCKSLLHLLLGYHRNLYLYDLHTKWAQGRKHHFRSLAFETDYY